MSAISISKNKGKTCNKFRTLEKPIPVADKDENTLLLYLEPISENIPMIRKLIYILNRGNYYCSGIPTHHHYLIINPVSEYTFCSSFVIL